MTADGETTTGTEAPERPKSASEERERKQRILTHGTPSITSSIADAVVIKDGNVFFLTTPDGGVPDSEGHGFGLYYHDCRYLRTYELRLGGCLPTVLAASADPGNVAVFQLANPDLRMPDGRLIPKESIGIKWTRTLDGEEPSLTDVLEFQNFGFPGEAELHVSLDFAAKFEDIFAVRGLFREPLGRVRAPAWSGDTLTLAYDGKDGRERTVTVAFSTPLDVRDGTRAGFTVHVARGTRTTVTVTVRIAERPEDEAPRAPHHVPPTVRTSGLIRRGDAYTGWTSVHSDSLLLNEVIERSFRDLRMLRSSIDGQEFFAAGIPWFGTLFGRDSAITALQTLAFEPQIAEHTARLLAHFQGHRTDDWRDEQPGKILHSIRVGEMARLGEIPHTPYYGSVDATPLFLILIGRHAAWTGDLTLFHDLRDAIDLALHWMATDADADGDGYIEYASTSERGLINQGWKDSGDAIIESDGRIATPPIALVEVQGYAYLARLLMADLFDRTGETARADQLRRDAAALRTRFNTDFWLEGKRFYTLALERDDRPLHVITSNPGHALWTGIADDEKARAVATRLMMPDMYNGWGIRTLSAEEHCYNPVGYHLGTVWPHDNSIIAAGCRRYGLDQEALRLFTGLAQAALHLTDYRIPELFAGFSRHEYAEPVHFPVACHPQAWAAGSIPYLIETILGLTPEAFDQRLRVVHPMLPEFVDRLEMRDLIVGEARVDLRFERTRDRTIAVTVLETRGPLEVLVEPGPPAESMGA